MEKYFSNSYQDARNLFIQSCGTLASAEMMSFPVIEKDNLFIDAAIFRGSNDSFVVHVSGTHGPEGYAGSAIQSAICTELSEKKLYSSNDSTSLPTIVLVHSLNPYGFSTSRRVNEDNVDLNRNFLTEEGFKEVMQRDPNLAGYVDLDHLINAKQMPTSNIMLNDIWGYLNTFWIVFKYGIHQAKKAFVAGNYHKPTGVGYGGQSLTKSAQILIDLANQLNIPTAAKHVALIDVHTGLGPYAVDTLLSDFGVSNSTENQSTSSSSSSSSESSADLKSIFELETSDGFVLEEIGPDDLFLTTMSNIFKRVHMMLSLSLPTSSITGGIVETKADVNKKGSHASSGYELTRGTVTGDFAKNFLAPHLYNTNNLISVGQEFGTVNIADIGKAYQEENYAFHYGTNKEKEIYTKRYQNCFYVQKDNWKKNVVRRGLIVFNQAWEYIKNKITICEAEGEI